MLLMIIEGLWPELLLILIAIILVAYSPRIHPGKAQ